MKSEQKNNLFRSVKNLHNTPDTVDAPDSSGGSGRRKVQGLKAATFEVPVSTESFFRTRDNACKLQSARRLDATRFAG